MRLLETVTLGELAAVGAILVAVGEFLRRVVPVLRKVGRLTDAFLGVPDDGRPGVLDRLDRLETAVDEVRELAATAAAELRPNGGRSTRDQVDAIRQAVDPTGPSPRKE